MKYSVKRLPFLWLAAVGAVLSMPQFGRVQEEKATKKTYTYKTVEKCKIQADVYRMEGEKIQPVVIWIHGGALIMGSREQIDRALLGKILKAGYAVVSIDYRLASFVGRAAS